MIGISAMDFLPNNKTRGTATSQTVVAPPTPVATGKHQCGIHENGDSRLQSILVPNYLRKYNMASSTAATKSTVVAPPIHATKERDQSGKLKEYEIIELDIGTSSNSLKQIVSNRAKPFQIVNADKVLDVEGFQRQNQVIDLNRTPPQKPQRKKHRPDLKTLEQNAVKRKYVKMSNGNNVGGSAPGKGKYIDPNNLCRNQSVKRRLNLDLNDTQVDKLNTHVSEASEAVKDVLSSQIPPATHSSTNDNANRSVRALDTPKRRRREEFDSLVFNMKTTNEGENSNRVDNEIDCLNIQRNKDKKLEESQSELKGRKRGHKDVDDGWVHTNTSGTPCFHDILKKRKTENDQSKILSNSCSIPPHAPNSWKNVNRSQNRNKASMNADKRKILNHILALNYISKDSTEIVLSNNRLRCPGKTYIQDNPCCSQHSTSKVLPENVSYGPRVRVEALIAHQTKAQTTKRMRKEKNQLVGSTTKNAKRMELEIDNIARKLACLNIYDVRENVIYEPHDTLVPFVGGGMLVPFSSPLKIKKKKKPRAKVDLDEESQKAWNILMGNESNGGEETNEKWWENERQVFLERTELFTARMHLIQGDRKFSLWKGSVVDSVIGVFLTQNVSDHLSSSAFMSLAAKFPVKSNSSNSASNVETPAWPMVTELSSSTESSFSERAVGRESSNRVLGSNVTSCAIRVEGEKDNIRSIEDVLSSPYSNFFTSFTQLLHMANNSALHAINVTGNQSSDECDARIDWSTLRKGNYVHIQGQSGSCPSKEPDLTNLDPLNNNKAVNKNMKSAAVKTTEYDWDSLRREAIKNGFSKERSCDTADSMDYESLRNAHVSEIASAIRERGLSELLAERIKAFLDRLARDHGSVDLEWLRHVSPEKTKDYLLSVNGLGLKSVECIRLLTLHQLAFPVDTNVARISVRLGWVPLQPLPESLQLHLLEKYPVMDDIQKYLWPRLCKLDQEKLYELHYQLITFGKVFCTKAKPNCSACPMRGECKHFASAHSSARLALPEPEEKRIVNSEILLCSEQRNAPIPNTLPFPQLIAPTDSQRNINTPRNSEPIIEEPSTPEPECVETTILDIEDDYYNDSDEIPTIKLNLEEFPQKFHNYIQENNLQLQDGNLSNALITLSPEAASIPAPKLKNANRLRTEHQVYELPDYHPLLKGMDNREPDDPCKYLLAIWTPGETAQSTEAPKSCCDSYESGKMCGMDECFSCNSIKERQSQTVRGTILIPCRTATKGSFPLNGTFFQVNEVFADHDSSRFPIDVPREWLWKLETRTVYFGTSIPSIFKGLTTKEIQDCFLRGFVCVRGFDRTTRAPKPLYSRLHIPASKVTRTKRTAAAASERKKRKKKLQKQRKL